MSDTKKLEQRTKAGSKNNSRAACVREPLSEDSLFAFECIGRLAEYLHTPSGYAALVSALNGSPKVSGDVQALRNYVMHFSSCSENPLSLWIEHLTDAFSSVDDLALRVPSSGNLGRVEDAMNMRRYFYKSSQSVFGKSKSESMSDDRRTSGR